MCHLPQRYESVAPGCLTRAGSACQHCLVLTSSCATAHFCILNQLLLVDCCRLRMQANQVQSALDMHLGAWENLLQGDFTPGPRFALDGFGLGTSTAAIAVCSSSLEMVAFRLPCSLPCSLLQEGVHTWSYLTCTIAFPSNPMIRPAPSYVATGHSCNCTCFCMAAGRPCRPCPDIPPLLHCCGRHDWGQCNQRSAKVRSTSNHHPLQGKLL
jgi:hypothetical protein